MFALVLTLGGATCEPPPADDAGLADPVCTGEGADPATYPGVTGVGWEEFQDNEVLATWPRPQGGIGTRINVRAEGYDEETNFSGLTTQVFGEPGASCQADTDCADERAVCDGGSCRLFIANQVNRTFPVECLEDGALLVPELPVRFRNDFELTELDGADVELRVTLEPFDGEPTSSSVNLRLQVGEFIQPSWWEDA
jgi:hypothetical protein